MSQEITVTKVEDHHEMEFSGGSAYPVPTRAIEKLDDDLTPEEEGESVTFRGDYGGAKHMKSFTVEECGDEFESDDETHECEECGDEFESEHGLAVHEGMVHKDDEGDDTDDEAPAEQTNHRKTLVADGGEESHRVPTENDFPMGIPVQQVTEMEDESRTPVGGVEYIANHPIPHYWISHQDAGQTWVYVAIDRDDSVIMPSHDSWEAFLDSDRTPVGEPIELGEIVVQHLPEDGGMHIEERHHLDGETVVETGETVEELAIRLLHEMAGEESDADSETNDHIEAVRSLGQAVVELAEIDVPELDMTDDMIVEESSGDEWIELEQDEDWWDAWCSIFDTVEETIGSAQPSDNQIRPDIETHRQYDEIRATTDWTSLSVEVYASGSVRILAEYDAGDESSWAVMYDARPGVSPPDPTEIGRTIASAELAAIANEIGSAAKTLDYWQTRRRDGWYPQFRWADVRGKSKQTVGDNVRATRKQIEGDE